MNFKYIRQAGIIFNDLSITEPIERRLAFKAFEKIVSEKYRHYHSWENHIYPMLQYILSKKYGDEAKKAFVFAALFHDVIYNVSSINGVNELNSALYWEKEAMEAVPLEEDYDIYETEIKLTIDSNLIEIVSKIIRATYGHESNDLLVREFLKIDLMGFSDPYVSIHNETLIRKEFQKVDWKDYIEGREKFLQLYSENSIIKEMGVEQNLLSEIKHLKNLKPNIAIYPGSFNDFHIGHLHILEKAEKIFDKVIIVFAENPEKKWGATWEPYVTKALKDRGNQIKFVRGSMVKWIENLGYPVTMIRGLRNTSDVQYEQNYLSWLNSLSKQKLQVVNIFCDKEFEHISSSALRSLMQVDEDAAKKYIV